MTGIRLANGAGATVKAGQWVCAEPVIESVLRKIEVTGYFPSEAARDLAVAEQAVKELGGEVTRPDLAETEALDPDVIY